MWQPRKVENARGAPVFTCLFPRLWLRPSPGGRFGVNKAAACMLLTLLWMRSTASCGRRAPSQQAPVRPVCERLQHLDFELVARSRRVGLLLTIGSLGCRRVQQEQGGRHVPLRWVWRRAVQVRAWPCFPATSASSACLLTLGVLERASSLVGTC